MGFFKKRSQSGTDVVDLSDMKRRGLLPDKLPEADSQGVVDFSNYDDTSFPRSSDVGDVSSTSNGPSSSSAGDFLSSLANVGMSTNSGFENNSGAGIQPSPGPITSQLRAARARGQIETQVNEIRIKVDDNEFKIGQLTEKIKELDAKIRELKGY